MGAEWSFLFFLYYSYYGALRCVACVALGYSQMAVVRLGYTNALAMPDRPGKRFDLTEAGKLGVSCEHNHANRAIGPVPGLAGAAWISVQRADLSKSSTLAAA
jgi:hypothetical protein